MPAEPVPTAPSGPPGGSPEGQDAAAPPRPARRAVLGAGGLAALLAGGAAVGAATTAAVTAASGSGREKEPSPGRTSVPFHGTHQAGILDRRQTHAHLVGLDLAAEADRPRTAALLRRWSAAAERMSRGAAVGDDLAPPSADPASGRLPTARPSDTGIALDIGPASLTVTFGFGASLFDRLGLVAARPEALAPLPDFPGEQLDRARGGGDLFVQIAADDPLVAVHALRTVQRLARGDATPRWLMSGFTLAPGTAAPGTTPRNLMGQPDGTANPDPADARALAAITVTDRDAPPWLRGGSYVVVRRIRMLLDHWESLPLEHREQAVGRRTAGGAPLTGGTEHTPADLAAARPDGVPVIATNAHIRLAAPASNGGATMLRRSWSYHDGLRPDGGPDAGTLFVAWQSDPRTGFVPVQHRLSRGDALGRYLVHESSALFVAPAGAPPGGYAGQALLEG
ncbi:iron uptake transporter deferrochelatase/peroxidase subunit [Kitasatospora sp. NPDC090091]|uniref:iron uptake transporter deferrochelatase/peroxidase subunit n=1 Tax=Kitasatospora sp. NPDC090091 TaxID=3364081 RepID=UPI00382CA575